MTLLGGPREGNPEKVSVVYNMSSSSSGGLNRDEVANIPAGTVLPASAAHFLIPGLLTRDQARNPERNDVSPMSVEESVRVGNMGFATGVRFDTPSRRDVPRTQKVARQSSYY